MKKSADRFRSSWGYFSRKLADKIEKIRFGGSFEVDEAVAKNMLLVKGEAKVVKSGFFVGFDWLVDESDGVIADVKFQAFGPPSLYGFAEAVAEMTIRKHFGQAMRIDAESVDRSLQDQKGAEAFSDREYSALNLVLEAVESAGKQCRGLPGEERYVPTPVQLPDFEGPYPGWDTLSVENRIAVIEEVITRDIRPYVELDAGGIEIVSLTNGTDLLIAYKGACTTCASSTGATLEAIRRIVQAKVHPDIRVIPDKSFLGFQEGSGI